ncbi:MAG TPA: glycosyltransferase family 2 protein, partial [Flavisolibacter sp.]|nr:glycosyltransferase family 2 protein [Flavisolibacter sp.]
TGLPKLFLMHDPLISICIPAYKRIEYLKRLLDSIKAQDVTNYEIVLSDDTPDDSVKELVSSYNDPSIRYYKNMPAAGSPQNWNTCIEKAGGEWIKIMHDDDWFAASDSLRQFSNAIKNSNQHFIFSACSYIDESGKLSSGVARVEEIRDLEKDPLCLVYNNFIGHPSSVLHKKDAAIVYNPIYKWVVDIEFYIHYLQKHPGFYYIPQALVNIGTGLSQVSAECYKNPLVEIPEYLSLISDLGNDKTNRNKFVFFNLWNLVKKFKIKNREQLSAYYTGPVPEVLDFIINYQKHIPRIIIKQTPWSKYFMKRAFNRLQK